MSDGSAPPISRDEKASARAGARLGRGFLRRNVAAGYFFALGATAVAVGLRMQLGPDFVGFPFVTLFPAVILTTYFAGLGPGVLAGVLCGAAALYWFIPPFGKIKPANAQGMIAMAFYLLIVGLDILLIEVMNRALERLEAEQRITRRLYLQHRGLFQELQHRVANNMALVGSILRVQLRRVRDGRQDPEKAMADAVDRLEIMARVHRRLYDPAAADAPVGTLLGALCDDLSTLSGSDARCRVTAEPLFLELRRLLPLSLLVAEAMTNAIKHAGAPGRPPRIHILMRRDGPLWMLDVADDGPGGSFGAATPADGNGLGSRIMQNLAQQLDAVIEIGPAEGPPDRPGRRVRVRFPAEDGEVPPQSRSSVTPWHDSPRPS